MNHNKGWWAEVSAEARPLRRPGSRPPAGGGDPGILGDPGGPWGPGRPTWPLGRHRYWLSSSPHTHISHILVPTAAVSFSPPGPSSSLTAVYQIPLWNNACTERALSQHRMPVSLRSQLKTARSPHHRFRETRHNHTQGAIANAHSAYPSLQECKIQHTAGDAALDDCSYCRHTHTHGGRYYRPCMAVATDESAVLALCRPRENKRKFVPSSNRLVAFRL